MDYIALYRKFRPQSFEEMVGQNAVAGTLAKAVASGNIVHAYLFCGPRGTGKTSAAKILAKAVNCEKSHNGSPCGECHACRRIASGESLDIMEIDAASNRGIDEIRDLRERVKYAAATEKYKVYIIDEVHMLTTEAFNALLKTLEEPPKGVIFVLATTEPHKIPLTVISRCQRFDFNRISTEDILARLHFVAENEQMDIEEKALQLIARKAQGGLRDALGLLDQCRGFAEGRITVKTVAEVLGAVDSDFIAELAENILQGNIGKVLDMTAAVNASGKDMRLFISDLTDCFREILQKNITDRQKGERLLNILSLLAETESKLRFFLQPQTSMEICLIKCCGWNEQAASFPPITKAAPVKAQEANTVPPAQSIPETDPKQITRKAEQSAAPPPKEAAPQSVKQTAPSAEAMKKEVRVASTVTLSFERVQREWPELLAKVKAKSITLNAYMQNARPAALEGNLLTLSFPETHAVHMHNVVEKVSNKKLLENALVEQFGNSLNITAQLCDAAEETDAAFEAEESSLFD
ncbi:MAG: DNA polymerase III subunit gamma/tau [Firmicutes bacterium]|nr:DNA polymerase III subunit gamma/tau [Bacillota bacterium]